MSWLMALFIAATFAAPNKNACTAKELARKDCRLTVGSYNLRLLDSTVAWNDGTWRTVDDIPLKGEGVTWEKARFEFIGGATDGWPILQLWLWDAGVGEATVRSLHWYVADAEKRRLTILSEGVVRKRREKILDAMEPHALKPAKNGSLEWTLGRHKKILERKKDGI